MALAESVLRKVYKLGLLPKIIARLPLVSIVLALISVCWLLVLPMEGQYRNTYISENALMPGQVNSYFRETEWNYVRGFRSESSKWDFDEMSKSNPQLEEWLEDFGLTVSHHFDRNTNLTTMYALMHAPRGDNTESLVLVVPYFTSNGETNLGGFALAPALARYFARMSMWSKNFILVFPQDGHSVLRSWVEAYHTTLDVTAGSIEAAIVMEYASGIDNFRYMEIVYEGLNGQLPNLDLINVATTIARHENMRVSVQGISESELDINTYQSRLKVLARGVLNMALTGVTRKSFGCEAFSGWQIQAITIRALGTGGPDITQFGRIVDASFRSVNNLLEKFHQSFFFYLLLSPTHFVSIGTYLPAATLIATAYLVSSLYAYARGLTSTEFVSNIGTVLMWFSGIEAAHFVAATSLQKLVVNASEIDNIVQLVTIGFISFTVLLSSGPLLVSTTSRGISRPISYLILSFAQYFIGMLIVTLLIVNFALAFMIGMGAFPLTFLQDQVTRAQSHTPQSVKARVKTTIFLLVSSPITVIVLLGYIINGEKVAGVLNLVHGLLSSWHELQSWTWFVIALGWLPAWTALSLVCAFGDFSVAEKEKSE